MVKLEKTGRYLKGLILLSALIGLIFAPGCIAGTPTPEPITISFAFPTWDRTYYQNMVQAFNETWPHITVELRPKRGDMLGGIDGGDADIFLSSQFAQSWLKNDNRVLDLSPFVEQDEDFNLNDFSPGAVGLYSSGGKLWGIPAGLDLMVMYYNKDLFDEYSVSYPADNWTWYDLLDKASSLRLPESNIFGYIPTYGEFDAMMTIYQHGGRIFDDLENPTKTTFDDPLTIEALEWYTDLIYEYNVTPTEEQMQEAFGRASGYTGIGLGQVGMWSGLLSERKSSWMNDLNVGVVPLPRDQQAATLTLIEGFFISSKTEHADVCWTWISFLSKQLNERAVPVRRSLLDAAEFEHQVGAELAQTIRTATRDALFLSPELANFEDALALFSIAYQDSVSGKMPPEKALSRAQQQSPFK